MPAAIVSRFVVALLLLAGAVVARRESEAASQEADAWRDLLTFQFGTAESATAEYWLGRYDELAGRAGAGGEDPEVLFIAANASYRTAWRDAFGPDGPRKLDAVVQAYAAVLKADPGHADAAFNLELVSRRRDQIARQRPVQVGTGSGEPEASGPVRVSDLPVGPTLHGAPGGPPVTVPVEEFEVLIPRDAGDEETTPGQAGGGRLRRKG